MSNVKQITKPKHPGRVAAGQKLVAWNKNKKSELKNHQEPDQVPAQEPDQVPDQVPAQVLTTYYYGAGVLIVIAVGVLVYFKTKNQKPLQKTPKQIDPFCP